MALPAAEERTPQVLVPVDLAVPYSSNGTSLGLAEHHHPSTSLAQEMSAMNSFIPSTVQKSTLRLLMHADATVSWSRAGKGWQGCGASLHPTKGCHAFSKHQLASRVGLPKHTFKQVS